MQLNDYEIRETCLEVGKENDDFFYKAEYFKLGYREGFLRGFFSGYSLSSHWGIIHLSSVGNFGSLLL